MKDTMKNVIIYTLVCPHTSTEDGSPYVVVSSTDYNDVFQRREALAELAAAEPNSGLCGEPHPIIHTPVSIRVGTSH